MHEDQHGEKNIVAYIISDLEEGKDESTFRKDIIVGWGNQLRNHLPYFMIPSFWVRVKQFPLSPNGKVDVKKLAPPKCISARKQHMRIIKPISRPRSAKMNSLLKISGSRSWV
ncbi:hypothetical protein LWM68_13120 [Niabella sp. W65]|nr:hypothetical protein [Niabella sp. W65]MCH7363606.1 hypothetical protein [Niabella sp. W65]